MSKGLEALKHIVEIVDFYTKEKKYYDMRFFPQCDEVLWLETIEKELKALKFIVKKANIRPFEMNDRYYFTTTNNVYGISKEKYDLLKEVFNK